MNTGRPPFMMKSQQTSIFLPEICALIARSDQNKKLSEQEVIRACVPTGSASVHHSHGVRAARTAVRTYFLGTSRNRQTYTSLTPYRRPPLAFELQLLK